MIKVLTLINNLMDEMDVSYTFDNWDADLELPHFVGEISEVPTIDEDGCNEYSFILTGFAKNYSYLFSVAEQIRDKFKLSEIMNGIVIKYDNTLTISSDTDDLKQIQITLKIKEWSV